MRLIVGLGNPGSHYAGHRHNVGFQCLNALARAHHLRFAQRQAKARVAVGNIGSQPVLLAKPHTYMNQSGLAVAGLLRRWKLGPADLLVIYDDVDLPLGKIRLREKASAGGHKGMQSIIDRLGTEAFPRLRVGIGHPAGQDPVDYVLSDFSPSEKPLLPEVYQRVVAAMQCLLGEGMAAAMNRFNQ